MFSSLKKVQRRTRGGQVTFPAPEDAASDQEKGMISDEEIRCTDEGVAPSSTLVWERGDTILPGERC